MSEHLVVPDPESLALTDPSLVIAAADGRLIHSAEYYDEVLSGWDGPDPYLELSDLEDAMAGRAHRGPRRRPGVQTQAPDRYLFIRRPVVPADDLQDILLTLMPYDNPAHGTSCNRLGIDVNKGLHSTVLSTRGMNELELPDEEMFDPTLRVPLLGKALGKLSIEGVEILPGPEKSYLVLTFAQKAKDQLRRERDELEQHHFPSLRLQDIGRKRDFVPHVTLLSATDRDITEQAFKTVHQRARIPKKVDLVSARHTFCDIRYAVVPN